MPPEAAVWVSRAARRGELVPATDPEPKRRPATPEELAAFFGGAAYYTPSPKDAS